MPDNCDTYEDRLGVLEVELDRLVRRLRGLSLAAWRSRAAPVRQGLSELLAIEAATTGAPRPHLPSLPDYALADMAGVLGAEAHAALAASPDDTHLAEALSIARAVLDATR